MAKEKKEQTAQLPNDVELAKALDEFLGMVEEASKPEVVAKADNAEKPGDDEETRGGSDLIKNVKKADDKEEQDEDEEKEKAEKAEDDKDEEKDEDDKEVKKADKKDENDEEKDEDKKDEDKDEDDKDGKKKELPAFLKNKKGMKKSEQDEYLEFLNWKQEKAQLAKTQQRETLVSDLKKALGTETDEKLGKVGQILKALNEKVDRLNSSPARGRKSYESVQVIEKAVTDEGDLKKSEGAVQGGGETIKKAKLLQEAEKLCKAGLCEVEDITTLERTGKITPRLAKAVERAEQINSSKK